MLLRVLSALLREDVAGLRTRSTEIRAADGRWLRLGAGSGRALLLPVRDDGFQCTVAARLPLLRREPEDGDLTKREDLTTVAEVLTALCAVAGPADRRGFDAFAAECRADLLARRLHTATRDEVDARVTARYGTDPARWLGPAASVAFDTLAARTDHPVYPASRARLGMTEHQLRSYGPEFHPRFRLRWLALPAADVSVSGTGRGPGGAPAPALPASARTGLPLPVSAELPEECRQTHVLLPVHPLTAGRPLTEALAAAGLSTRAVLMEEPYLEVVPTLSMRTVALADDPGTHVKLPLHTSTLGLLNRRSIRPGTLRDGAACQRLLERVIKRERRFRNRVLLADETRYVSAGHELLNVLIRRQPPGLGDCAVVPLAALAARAPDGRPVICSLADRFYGGEVMALLDALLTLLLDWQTTLFGYGIALESHQQNVSLVLGGSGGPGPRLLLKDNDGPRVNTVRLGRTLGGDVGRLGFDDPRIRVDEDGPVADLFTTVTVHLCAGAWAFRLARDGSAMRAAMLDLVRGRLGEAVDRLAVRHRTAAAVLRSRVLEAPELPVKAMVTAGTLLTKARSGAADINKHYTTGPNYLLRKA
nr:IucA/IucC family siderophore biosynthesis protein [Streptomyces sp. HNM0575]